MSKVRVVVAGLVEQNGTYLLVKEKLKSGEKWIIPGGGVEFGESLEGALKRELREELGIILADCSFLAFKEAIFPDYDYHTIIFFYVCKTLDKPVANEDCILGLGYFTKADALKLTLVDSARWLFDHKL